MPKPLASCDCLPRCKGRRSGERERHGSASVGEHREVQGIFRSGEMVRHLVYGAGRCWPSRSRPIVPGDRGSLQLLGQLLGERVQFTAASRDPLQPRRSVRSASTGPSAGRARPPAWSWRLPPASVSAARDPSCTSPRAPPTPSGCTSRWTSGCVTARHSSRRGCRRQCGSSNADVRTSGGRSPPRLDVHSTHGSHVRSEGVPVPGCSCSVPVHRVRDGRRSGERVGDLLSRVARPRLAIQGNSRHFPGHSAPAGGPFSARAPLPTSVTARRRSSP